MAAGASPSRVVNLGCRLNAFEGEVIGAHLRNAGLADTRVVNSCAVTSEAERQTRQTIRRLRRENPGARIVVTGCAAQIDPEKYAAMPEVDRVVGNDEKLKAETYQSLEAEHQSQVGDIMRSTRMIASELTGFTGRTRAFLQIQQGCDHRCTFCIIPFGRGNSRSLNPDTAIRQARALVGAGHRELVLTGVDISSYGRDLSPSLSLGDLAGRILDHVPGLDRLRLSSLDPAVADEALIRVMAENPRLMPHLHLSVQAGSNIILKRMKRRHVREDVIRLCDRLRGVRPDIRFGADMIAGFPTETEAMFEESSRLVTEAGLTYLHVFPYSPRPGTPAARMPEVPAAVRRQRAAGLRTLGDARRLEYFRSLEGTGLTVLSEADGRGYSDHYAPVAFDRDVPPGLLVEARVTGAGADGLTARLAA